MPYQKTPTPEIRRQERMAALGKDAAILFFASSTVTAGLATLYSVPHATAIGLGVAAGFFVTLMSIASDGGAS